MIYRKPYKPRRTQIPEKDRIAPPGQQATPPAPRPEESTSCFKSKSQTIDVTVTNQPLAPQSNSGRSASAKGMSSGLINHIPEPPLDPPPRRRPKAASPTMPIPTESEEQQQLFLWAQWMEGQHPELALLHHIPNEGKRSKATGGRLVAEGLRKGVPDICLPVPNAIYHGLYIELKRINGRASEDQKRWISALNNQGYRAAICFGWDEAAKVIMSYLNIKGGPHHVEE